MSTDGHIPVDRAKFEADALEQMDALYRMALQLAGNAQVALRFLEMRWDSYRPSAGPLPGMAGGTSSAGLRSKKL